MTDRTHPPGALAALGLAGAPRGGRIRLLRARFVAGWECWRAERRRVQARRELARLDPRTLRDIGIAPCEIDSLLAEMDGHAAATRTRVLMSQHRTGLWT